MKGATLIELMIALVIGSVIIVGALEVYARGRDLYRVSERISRLQEQGRVALSVLEPDIELAGYYGFAHELNLMRLARGGRAGEVLATVQQMRQLPMLAGGPMPPAVSGLPAGAHACGVNFAVDVMTPVQASNNSFALGRAPTACDAYQGQPREGADTLTLRRAETQTATPEANRLQLFTSRLDRTMQVLFADGTAPGSVDADHRVHNFVVRAYYVAQSSVGQPGFPALRVKSLTRAGSGLAFADDEVMPGIEDLQVQLVIEAGLEVRYVNPGAAGIHLARVVGVRIWVRVRADEAEAGFTDTRTYRYADVVYTPSGPEQHFRRVLLSRTIAVRNVRPS